MLVRKILLTTGSFVATALTATAAQAGEKVEIRNFVGTINWTNGALDAQISQNKGETKISTKDGLLIDGGLTDIAGEGCKNTYAKWSWGWGKKKDSGTYGGYENLKNLPVIDIYLPEDAELIVTDAVIFTIGTPNIGSAQLDLNYCGEVTLGDINGSLIVKARGSADLEFGTAQSVDIESLGSSDVEGGDVTGNVIISARGSGNVELDDVGSLTTDVRGSGDVEVGDISGDFAAGSKGSGDIETGDISGNIVIVAYGSSDFETGNVESEEVEIEVSGSSNINLDGGQIETLMVNASGSSDVTIVATVTTANLRASGSSDIYIERVTGTADTNSSHSADITINERD